MFSNSSAGQYFRKRLTLANSIVVAGGGIGPLAMGPFYQLILSNHGWRVMLRILSGLAFVMFLCTLLYRPLPDKYKKQTKKESRNESRFFDLSVWKMKPFVVWVVSTSLMFIGYFVPFFHLVRRHSFYRLNSHTNRHLISTFLLSKYSFSFLDTLWAFFYKSTEAVGFWFPQFGRSAANDFMCSKANFKKALKPRITYISNGLSTVVSWLSSSFS